MAAVLVNVDSYTRARLAHALLYKHALSSDIYRVHHRLDIDKPFQPTRWPFAVDRGDIKFTA